MVTENMNWQQKHRLTSTKVNQTLSMFTAEFVEFVLGVPELLKNGQRPDISSCLLMHPWVRVTHQ